MSLSDLLEHARTGLSRRLDRRVETVDAVFDDDLWGILESLGLLEALDAGELTCAKTGVRLSRENLGGIIITSDGPKLFVD